MSNTIRFRDSFDSLLGEITLISDKGSYEKFVAIPSTTYKIQVVNQYVSSGTFIIDCVGLIIDKFNAGSNIQTQLYYT